jgi:glycosyltransferase involved in cell wall biosynthesis
MKMIKIAHFVQVAPCRSGLYETSREIAYGQCKYLNWDARMIDVTGIVTGSGEPIKEGEDRGVKIADLEWAKKADIHFLHTGIPGAIEGSKPTYYFAHGLPEYVFYSQVMMEVSAYESVRQAKANTTPFNGPWSLITTIGKKDWMKGAITLWKRHKPYLEPYFKKVIQSNHFCNLDNFLMEGNKTEYVKPATGKGLNITFADHWRYTAFKDPFQVLHGARKFCQETGSKIHLYAVPSEEISDLRHPWNSIIHGVSDELKHTIGDFYGIHGDIASVHRTADLLITPSCDDTRTILESSACGCPVIARHGTECASYHCRMEDPEDVNKTLYKAYEDIIKNREATRVIARKLAEKLTLEDAVKKIEKGLIESL